MSTMAIWAVFVLCNTGTIESVRRVRDLLTKFTSTEKVVKNVGENYSS